MKILFEYGASLQPKTNDGETPLHLAAKWGHLNIVKWLVDKKANLNIIDNSKSTAYDLAKTFQHYDVANYLAPLYGKPSIDR